MKPYKNLFLKNIGAITCMHGFMNILLNVIAYVKPGAHNEQKTGGLGASTAHIIDLKRVFGAPLAAPYCFQK